MKKLPLLLPLLGLPLLGLPLLGAAQTDDQTRQMTNLFNSGFSPVVRNSDAVQGSSLLLAVCGRRVSLDDLEGPGLPTLAAATSPSVDRS